MLHERIFLDPSDDRVYIDTYVADDHSHLHDAMLVIPGGGYSAVCSDREGEPIALAYLAKGYNCFVLHYRVVRERYPRQLIDASRAIIHIRENAEKYAVDRDRVFAVGFSAGGHLAGSLAILHNDPEVLNALNISEGDNRPNGVVMAYPVVTACLPTHRSSFEHLTGGTPFDDIPDDVREKLSLEKQVNSKSAPAFIWHTAEDVAVPSCGSLALASSYVDAKIPVMMKLYPYGPHGVALSNKVTVRDNAASIQPLAEGWVDDSVEFFNTLKK